MGKRGPKPTPTGVLKIRGSWRADYARKGEPKATGLPTLPEWLDEEAKAAWKRLVPQLAAIGCAASLDENALIRYCQLWSRWIKASQFLQKYGDTYPLNDSEGKLKCFQQHPQVSIVRNLSVVLSKLEAEFGLTPAARAGLSTAGTGGDELDEYKIG